MKKKLFVFVMFGIVMFGAMMGCDDEKHTENTPNLQVENEEALTQVVYADQTQGENSVTFTTVGEWTSSTVPEEATLWLSINPKKGDKAGNYTVSITLETNASGEDRTAVISIACKGEEIAINVTQKATTVDGKPYKNLQVENEEALTQVVYADQTQGENSVTFTSAGAWTSHVVPADASSWISINPKNGDRSGNYVVSITLKTNSSGEDRTAVISIICKGEEIAINVTQKATTIDGKPYKEPDVYVAGYKNNANEIAVATLWKNGVEQKLTDGTNFAWAYSVFVSDSDDVYVAGFELNAEGIEIAKLWKNGKAQNLTDGTNKGIAYSVYVSGIDVYVAGQEVNGISRARLWKNGVVQEFTEVPNVHHTYAYSVYVSAENDVFVAGSEYDATTKHSDIATIWRNGEAQKLSNGTSATSVYVSGSNDVYVVGFEQNAQGIIAKLWKNDEEQNLINGTNRKNAYANSVYVSGDDVYIAGYEFDYGSYSIATLWKNGVAQNLTGGTFSNSVFVKNNDVYVAGRYAAKLWKNSVAIDLTDISIEAGALSVFVK